MAVATKGTGRRQRRAQKRARIRRRVIAQQQSRDLRPEYDQRALPAADRIGVVTIEDPYAPAGQIDSAGNLIAEAQREPVRHGDGSLNPGAPAWMPPSRPTLKVIVNLRDDPIGRMHSRRQVDAAQYSAARAYQQLYERATVGNLSPADLLRPRVDGGRIPEPISAARIAATKRLRSVEGTVKDWHGFCRLTTNLIRSLARLRLSSITASSSASGKRRSMPAAAAATLLPPVSTERVRVRPSVN
jgi:hypothetical protein